MKAFNQALEAIPSNSTIRTALSNTIYDALKRTISRFPQQTAIHFAEREWSYQALDQAILRVAYYLHQQGLKSGDRVLAYGKNSDAYVLLWLACNRLGLIHVPTNFALFDQELLYIVKQSDASCVFYDPELADNINAIKDQIECQFYGTLLGGQQHDILSIALDHSKDELIAQPNSLPMIDFDDHAIAQILYTSGTTSDPKGAMLSHRALLAEYTSSIIALEITQNDCSLVSLPLYHSAQMHVFLMSSLLTGGKNIIIKAPLAELCFELFEKEKITSFFAPPTVWISFLRHAQFDPDRMQSVLKGYYGASIMPLPVLEELREKLPKMRIFNCYGQSEIGPLATVLSPEDHEIAPASAGRAILNVHTRVVNDDMTDTAIGEVGEIVHRSPQLMSGYWRMPEKTQEAFEGGWFHSGDLGYLDENGLLYVVDRMKDVINTGGVLVSSREVEECIYKHPAVAEVAVIAIDDEKWVEAIAAVVQLKDGHEDVTKDELIDFAKEKIAPFKVPKKIFFKEALPKNTAGKLLKRELRKEYS